MNIYAISDEAKKIWQHYISDLRCNCHSCRVVCQLRTSLPDRFTGEGVLTVSTVVKQALTVYLRRLDDDKLRNLDDDKPVQDAWVALGLTPSLE